MSIRATAYAAMTIAALCAPCFLSAPAMGQCPDPPDGYEASSLVNPGQTVVLNPREGVVDPGDPMTEVLVMFTNTSTADPPPVGFVEVCEFYVDPHSGALAYETFGTYLSVVVTGLDDGEFVMRVAIPFVGADVTPGADAIGADLTYYDVDLDPDVWLLSVTGNTVNSPQHGENVGDRWTLELPTTPTRLDFMDVEPDIGDYGVVWCEALSEGFVWANVDHANDFAPGTPLCWSDLNQDGNVDISDLFALLGAWGPCPPTQPIGCTGDIYFDGLVGVRDLALLLAYFGEYCYEPPGDATIDHSIVTMNNGAGDAQWDNTGGLDYLTWDLKVDGPYFGTGVPGTDAWTTSTIDAVIHDAYGTITFYQHPAEEALGAPPLFVNCPGNAALPFDTYIIEASDAHPCDIFQALPGAYTGEPFTQAPKQFTATWYDGQYILNPGPMSPAFTIARITMMVDRDDTSCPLCELDIVAAPSGTHLDPPIMTITGLTTHKYGLSDRFPYSFDIVNLCAADLNEDGDVTTVDLLRLLGKWGQAGVPSDLNRDGVVSTVDLLNLLGRWGPCDGGAR